MAKQEGGQAITLLLGYKPMKGDPEDASNSRGSSEKSTFLVKVLPASGGPTKYPSHSQTPNGNISTPTPPPPSSLPPSPPPSPSPSPTPHSDKTVGKLMFYNYTNSPFESMDVCNFKGVPSAEYVFGYDLSTVNVAQGAFYERDLNGENFTAEVQVIYDKKGSYTITLNSKSSPMASYTGHISGYKADLNEAQVTNFEDQGNNLLTIIKFTVEPM